jgi:hypothetical protein
MDEMGRKCSTRGGDEKFIKNVTLKTSREEATCA